MKRGRLNELKQNAAGRKEKSADLDIIVASVMALPYGQVKKVLTEEVMAVLRKYGYTE